MPFGTVIRQSVFERWPIGDGTVQAIITSPPYWRQRRYAIPDVLIGGDPDCVHSWGEGNVCEVCGGWKGQYGLEPDWRLYLAHTLQWLNEAYRVLRPDGLMFLNIGDHFYNKTMLDLPYRVSMALVDSGRWYKRNNNIWHKPNGIPGSMHDRFLSRHEPVMMFSKSELYYFDQDAVRQDYRPDSIRRSKYPMEKSGVPGSQMPDGRDYVCRSYNLHPDGAAPGDVWEVSATKCTSKVHASVWPLALPRRMILCSTRPATPEAPGDLVLDPFCGSGTTLLVAESLKRRWMGLDLGYERVQRDVIEEAAPLLHRGALDESGTQGSLFFEEA